MPARSERWFFLIVLIIFILLITLPYVYAFRAGGADYVFGGFLFNPLDGNSYLAKMQEGWRGGWRFTLLYSAGQSAGAYLFLFYLFLGHLARWTGLGLVFTYHLARVLCSIWMAAVIYRFLAAVLPGRKDLKFALMLVVFGSGLGWLALPFGGFTADFWVAEAFPFLSAFANPHFPLAIGLMLTLLMPAAPGDPGIGTRRLPHLLSIIALSAALALVAPFGVVIVSLVLLGMAWGEAGSGRRIYLSRLVVMGVAASPILIYTLLAVRLDPVLAGWNAQNLTPSPPWWNTLVAFSPVLLLAAANLFDRASRTIKGSWAAGIWAAISLVLMYLPWSLQRRFSLGWYIPLCVLAVIYLASRASRLRFWPGLAAIVLVLALPTNAIILFAGVQAAGSHDSLIYLRRSEMDALNWIDVHSAAQAVVLAGPEMGLFIPAHTGRRVIYGHPFETVNAEVQKSAVVNFFEGGTDPESLNALAQSDYVFLGPRERALGRPELISGMELVFKNVDVEIYQHAP